jgi:hypothetical protein
VVASCARGLFKDLKEVKNEIVANVEEEALAVYREWLRKESRSRYRLRRALSQIALMAMRMETALRK